MFKLIRPLYVNKKYAGKKFPTKPMRKIKPHDIVDKFKTPKFVRKCHQ